MKTLKQLRESKGLTQKQASEILDITKEYLSMLERAERNPSDHLKEVMARLYGIPITDIFLSIQETKCFTNKNEIRSKMQQSSKKVRKRKEKILEINNGITLN